MFGTSNKTVLAAAFVAAVGGMGCGEKSEPPLTTESIAGQTTNEPATQPLSGVNRPQGNPGAPFQPKR